MQLPIHMGWNVVGKRPVSSITSLPYLLILSSKENDLVLKKKPSKVHFRNQVDSCSHLFEMIYTSIHHSLMINDMRRLMLPRLTHC